MTTPILLQEGRDGTFYFVRGDSSIMRLGPTKGHKYKSAAARMLLYDRVYTSDRAELRIVSQILRERSLYNGSNSADSEDKRMIDGIITSYRTVTVCIMNNIGISTSFLPEVRLCTFEKNGSFVDCTMTGTSCRRCSGTNQR
ncbi:hypothetical protein PUN28_018486 [Cardiocondyla obscurior]|uniref:Uncharacterized protein n=1 Tax=Cardiocondyla obscurior TaxID=286306 RepID=A0AAW2EHY7_9HYME